MANPNVFVDIISQFDAKGFKQADKSINILTKRLAKFIGGLALAHKAQQAMFNAMADQKSMRILQTNLKNVGLAYAQIPAEQFIQSMQRQTGILDDELRPAYAQLARVTGSVAETQRLMKLAFDVSSGSGEDFNSVIDTLSQAYVGNLKGLKKLNLGLTQNELKSKSFSEIVDILSKQFSGAGASALDTYAGKLSIVQAAASDASETIGYSLLNAFQTASGSTGIQDFISKIDSAAQALADLITYAGRGTRAMTILWSATSPAQKLKDFKQLMKDIASEDLAKQAAAANAKMKMWRPAGYVSPAEKKAQEAAAARAKELLAIQKKITSEKKAQIQVDKANALIAKAKEQFDLEGIQLAAALMNQTLTIEERKRLEVKQATWDLEQALAQNDQARIASATALLEKLLAQFKVLQDQLMTLNDMYKVLAELGVNRQLIDLLNLEDAINLMNQMAILGQLTLPKNFPAPTATMVSKQEAAAALAAATTPEAMAWTQHETQMAANRASFLNQPTMTTATAPTPVVVNITDNAQKVVDVVVQSLQEYDASGISTRVIRNTGGLSW